MLKEAPALLVFGLVKGVPSRVGKWQLVIRGSESPGDFLCVPLEAKFFAI